MKKGYLMCIYSFASILVFALLFDSCEIRNENEITISRIWTQDADLTISNLTTGETTQGKSITYTNGELSNIITFKHGEVMQLKYTPPEEYKKNSFTIEFQVFDLKEVVTQSPYIYEVTIAEDIPIGSYAVYCSAMCNLWAKSSSSTKTIEFRVEQ